MLSKGFSPRKLTFFLRYHRGKLMIFSVVIFEDEFPEDLSVKSKVKRVKIGGGCFGF
jgi:hypothetical protein